MSKNKEIQDLLARRLAEEEERLRGLDRELPPEGIKAARAMIASLSKIEEVIQIGTHASMALAQIIEAALKIRGPNDRPGIQHLMNTITGHTINSPVPEVQKLMSDWARARHGTRNENN